MAEIEWPVGHAREGHNPDLSAVFLDLHRLVCLFFASERWARLFDPFGEDPITDLQEREVDEITRILITSATIGRIIEDRDGRLDERRLSCGILVKDLRRPRSRVRLTLREACNKIIHATKIRTDLHKDRAQRIIYFRPIMYFYGSLHGREWKATLRIVDYARSYYSRFKDA